MYSMSESVSQDHAVMFASLLFKLNDSFGWLKRCQRLFGLSNKKLFILADKNGQNTSVKNNSGFTK